MLQETARDAELLLTEHAGLSDEQTITVAHLVILRVLRRMIGEQQRPPDMICHCSELREAGEAALAQLPLFDDSARSDAEQLYAGVCGLTPLLTRLTELFPRLGERSRLGSAAALLPALVQDLGPMYQPRAVPEPDASEALLAVA